MVHVVQADGDELGHSGDRAAHAGFAAHQRQIGRFELAQFGQRGVSELRRVDVFDDAAEVTQLAIGIDQARFFLAGVAITNEFHAFSSFLGLTKKSGRLQGGRRSIR